MFTYLRLSQDSFDMSWPPSEECEGHSLDDPLPFSGLGSTKNETTKCSNRDLLQFFDPTSDQLNYMYADFAFLGHCR